MITQDPTKSLGALELDHLDLLLQWGDRTQILGVCPQIQYVLPFENKGVEVGVTLHHPHGQIYAYPFVPPVPAKMLAPQQHDRLKYLARTELAAGLFANDALPKEKAKELQAVAVSLEGV